MKAKMEEFPANNPNPVISIEKDGTVLYSNEAGKSLLHAWSVEIGAKLPSYIGNIVQEVISHNKVEKIEVSAGNREYLVMFYLLPEQECVNISGFDISDQKKLEEKLRIKEKQNDVLYKIGKISLKYESLQTFMDESVKLIASVLDLEYCKIMELMPDGRFLMRAGIGWKSEFVGKQVVGGENRSQAGYTLLSKMPVIVEDFEKENRFEKPEILSIHGVVSGASVVIGSMEKPLGVLVVNSTKKRKFTSDDTYFLNSVAFLIAQTVERKKAEEALKKSHVSLEEKVKERTAELEKAYISLKESEERLAEAQKLAHVGSYDWNIATDEEYWSDELYRIFGLDPQFELNHNTFLNYIHPRDLEYVSHAINEALNGKQYYIDYRVILPDGEERVIYSQGGAIYDEKNKPIRMRGIVQDITERKKAEESLANIESARKREIHHRIKNNLQVISSLLDLQAEKFTNRKWIKDSEVIEAYKESKDRVISMALIHEELYKGGGFEMLNFSPYIEKLAENLFQTYRLGTTDVSLNIDLEENALFNMDTAVPLGIIVNELVSNSLKYAFVGKDKGEIGVRLRQDENSERKSEGCKSADFILTVSDNGVGIPDNLDIENLDSLGLQLVTSLVEQLDGELELKRNNGTEFTIRFTVTEKSNQAPASEL